MKKKWQRAIWSPTFFPEAKAAIRAVEVVPRLDPTEPRPPIIMGAVPTNTPRGAPVTGAPREEEQEERPSTDEEEEELDEEEEGPRKDDLRLGERAGKS